jgi:hypothetical protein
MREMIIRPMKKTWINRFTEVSSLLLFCLLAGCRAGITAPPETEIANFIPPTVDPADLVDPASDLSPLPTRQADCENQLEFLEDLTIPDGTEVEPGQAFSKRWLIKNTGSCNWDRSYSLQLISGLALGAEKLQGLYPARQATRAVLEIIFTAPDNPGRYNSWWQAYDPDGNRFGDPVYLEITVLSE